MNKAMLVCLLVAGTVLAGCAQKDPAADGTPVVPTATTGILRGLVVDDAIRPLFNVSIMISGASGSRNATTLDDGLFLFGDLDPGNYLVQAKKKGFFAAQVTADVRAGIAQPELVRVVLAADPLNTPYIEPHVFEGFLQCSVTLVAARLAACSPGQFTEALCKLPVPVCIPNPVNVTEDDFMAVHTITRSPITFLQSEMAWESSQALGASLRSIPGSRDPADGEVQDLRAYEGPSPLIMPTKGELANGLLIGNGKDYVVRTFSGYVNGTAPPCLPGPVGCQWGVGTTVNQRFQLYTHVFYGFTPPEGWQFGRDGLPDLPK